MSKVPKIGSKIPGYRGGILPIHNINIIRNAMEMSNICDPPILHKVIYERKTMISVYIILFI